MPGPAAGIKSLDAVLTLHVIHCTRRHVRLRNRLSFICSPYEGTSWLVVSRPLRSESASSPKIENLTSRG